MGRVLKKGERGAATSYVSRKQALKKLQISLKDFRRLCILKGIYPTEPRHKKKANKNNSTNKTYYYLKDIQFLLHEPIIDKFRAFKVFMKRLNRFIGRKDQETSQRIRNNPPSYTLDHIVRERYPTFVDALRDVDDALSMCFLFSTVPKTRSVKVELIQLCRKLTVEFMHYVIETRSLKKVFISIKGFYYQAEIMGQLITWIVPHALGFSKPNDVDFKIMVTFTEFYSTMLGFINFKLYHSLNLLYPPKITIQSQCEQNHCQGEDDSVEYVASLNRALKRSLKCIVDEEAEADEIPELEDDNIAERLVAEKEEQKLKQLFEGCKIFLNREVPQESLVFVIRSFGGLVSYDKSLSYGATFEESDETITHQIVDRLTSSSQFISRYYVQPQWVYDCVNRKMLLPVECYFPGEMLPPHLSPFVEDEHYSLQDAFSSSQAGNRKTEESCSDDSELDDENEKESDEESEDFGMLKQTKKLSQEVELQPAKMKALTDEMPSKKEDLAKKEAAEEKRLAILMMSKKRKHLYDKIIFGQKRQKREALKLREKAEACAREQRRLNKRQKKRQTA